MSDHPEIEAMLKQAADLKAKVDAIDFARSPDYVFGRLTDAWTDVYGIPGPGPDDHERAGDLGTWIYRTYIKNVTNVTPIE